MLNDLQEELDRLFTFERNISAPYLALSESYRKLRGVQHANIKLHSLDYKVSGIAEHYHLANGGAVIYEYAVDRVIRMEGECLPAPLNMLQNCEHHYYGLKLNCLAFLSEKRIKNLMLIDSYNGVSFGIRYNPSIVQTFLATLANKSITSEQVIHKPQSSLFAA
jgi:hypothetical protein